MTGGTRPAFLPQRRSEGSAATGGPTAHAFTWDRYRALPDSRRASRQQPGRSYGGGPACRSLAQKRGGPGLGPADASVRMPDGTGAGFGPGADDLRGSCCCPASCSPRYPDRWGLSDLHFSLVRKQLAILLNRRWSGSPPPSAQGCNAIPRQGDPKRDVSAAATCPTPPRTQNLPRPGSSVPVSRQTEEMKRNSMEYQSGKDDLRSRGQDV